MDPRLGWQGFKYLQSKQDTGTGLMESSHGGGTGLMESSHWSGGFWGC